MGYWLTDGYGYEAFKAIKEGHFVGLALDEENQSQLTEDRIQT